MEKKITINVQCMFCGKNVKLEVYPSDLKKYQSGEGYVQDIFSYLTPGQREILISNMCEECFEKI